MITLAFAAAWVLIFIANIVVAVQIVRSLKALQRRVRTIVPADLPRQMRVAARDVQRTRTAFVHVIPLAKRGVVAVASIAHSVATFVRMARAVRAVWGL